MNNLTELLEKVIESDDIKRMFLRMDLNRAIEKKYSTATTTNVVGKKNKKYRVTLEITVQSVEEL